MCKRNIIYCLLAGYVAICGGCTGVSKKIAIDASREVESRQDQIFEQLAFNIELYQYNELKSHVQKGTATDDVLASIWSDRHGLGVYMIEWERIRCLKKITVDRVLYDSQSIIDIKIKNFKEWLSNAKLGNANPAATQPVVE